jgi:hypothetical protein
MYHFNYLGHIFWNRNISDEDLQPGKFLDISSFRGGKAYIRKVYCEFWTRFINSFIHDGVMSSDVLNISRAPGIGKTMFLWYLLCQLKKTETCHVYLTYGNMHFDFYEKHVYQVDSISAIQPHIYIFDANNEEEVKPMRIFPITYHIIISSPTVKHTKHVDAKKEVRKLTPLWSLGELEACRDLLYSSYISEEDLHACIAKWGHFPLVCYTDYDAEGYFSNIKST